MSKIQLIKQIQEEGQEKLKLEGSLVSQMLPYWSLHPWICFKPVIPNVNLF
jgi:hypothetical protein